MSEKSLERRAFRFGIFELDLQARELRRRGVSVKLQEKPLQILEMLLQRAGEVVPRKDLRQRLWPDTFVGFDRSLNTAVNALRKALGDAPGNPRFLETRSRLGYRFIAPVEAISRTPGGGLQAGGAADSIAVLPFDNLTGDPEMEYVGDGITETLIGQLSRLPEVRVMARSTVFRFKGRSADPQAVGSELNVRALLTGTVMQRGDNLTIGAELVDAIKGWRLWGEQYNLKFNGIFAVQEEISREIIEKLRPRLTEETGKLATSRHRPDPEAYRAYLRGLYHFNKMTEDGLGKAMGCLEEAIQRDAHFALSYAALSDAHALLAYFGIFSSQDVMPKAEAAARKALHIDPDLAEIHATLAGILKSFHWDWEGAEGEYKKALSFNPNSARAHQWYADFLSAMKRHDEAIREMDRALDLDPLSLIIHMEKAWILYMGREYEAALEQARKTLEIEPQFSPAHHVLGLASEELGRREEAIHSFERAHAGSGGNPLSLGALGHAFAAAGQKTQAKKILKELKDRSKSRYLPPYAPALILAGMGDISQSLDWLERAYDERGVWLVWAQTDPRLDSLREEPRFIDLLRRMNLSA
ncbi:MAG: winged helix-turn-helix domain-containing protein [Acidobacteriota bacterium]|nr:winged helix-turn-helix domain-containing protein [Acidobacteriota bacterium]